MEQIERQDPAIIASDEILTDIRNIIESSRKSAYQAVNTISCKKKLAAG